MMKKYKLLKTSLLFVAATGLIGLILCAVHIQNDTSLDSFQEVTAQTTSRESREQIKIGVIGDSWVAFQKLDRAIEQTVAALGFEMAVLSSGHPGARSRQIYRNLFLEKATKNSSNALFMDENLDYLVVVAGVNDSAEHIGKRFYAHHILLIVQAALARGVKPVIVELPEYGIEHTPSTLRERIQASGIADKVSLVDFSLITGDYNTSKGLYVNPSHLSRDGYSKLGKLIAHNIVEWHNNAMHSDGNSAALHSRR